MNFHPLSSGKVPQDQTGLGLLTLPSRYFKFTNDINICESVRSISEAVGKPDTTSSNYERHIYIYSQNPFLKVEMSNAGGPSYKVRGGMFKVDVQGNFILCKES